MCVCLRVKIINIGSLQLVFYNFAGYTMRLVNLRFSKIRRA